MFYATKLLTLTQYSHILVTVDLALLTLVLSWVLVDSFGERRGEVQAAMRDVGYGGFGPGGGGWT